jgi:hypothetical protein
VGHQPRGPPPPHPAAAAQDEGAGACPGQATPPLRPQWAPQPAGHARKRCCWRCCLRGCQASMPGIEALPWRAPAQGFPAPPCFVLPQGASARVVVLTSYGHNFAKQLPLDDLNWERRPYSAWPAYGQAKLSNALFARELARRREPGALPVDRGSAACLPATGLPSCVQQHPLQSLPSPALCPAGWRSRGCRSRHTLCTPASSTRR